MSIVDAVISEKLAYLGADMNMGFYTISHPVQPLRHAAANERVVHVKAVATGNLKVFDLLVQMRILLAS